MSKPRNPSIKRDCESRKNDREEMKREKAALKRQRRDNGKSVPKPLTPDVVRATEADTQRSDDQDACFLLPEESESEADANVGTESCTG